MTQSELEANRICVPIRLEAMPVGASPKPTVFANIPDDFSRLSLDLLGSAVPSDLMGTQTRQKPGVHLNWSLPEGLRQGFQAREETEPEYPNVPERWIVTRLWSTEAQPDLLLARHWIVESDALEEGADLSLHNADSLTYPRPEDPRRLYRILGRSYPHEATVAEPAGRLSSLTALGPGNPAFSAMYPYHVNVLGFYDDLTDETGSRLEHVSIGYVVRGMYRDGRALLRSAEECRERYGWQPPEALVYPASPVLHGMLSDLRWIDDRTDYNGPTIRNLPMPKLAVGNTSAEAVAALHGQHERSGERLMSVLLHDQSHKLLNLNGIYQADYAQHDRRFVVHAEQKAYRLQPDRPESDESDRSDLSPTDRMVYRNLQRGIDERYRLSFDADAKRSSIYDLWCKYMIKAQNKNPNEKPAIRKWMTAYREQLYQRILELDNAEIALEQAEEHLRLLERQLAAAVQGAYELKQASGSRYYVPNPPVLLLSGAGRGPLFDSQSPEGGQAALPCRTLRETISALRFEITVRGQAYAPIIQAAALLPIAMVQGEYPRLLLEGALLCPGSADRIVTRIAQQLGLTPFSPEERAQVKAQVRRMQRELTAKPVDPEERLPSAIFAAVWTPPWNPVLLCWRGLYYPDSALIGSRPALDHWTFGESDYVFSGPPVDTGNPVALSGRIFLTPHISRQLQAMAAKTLGDDLPGSLGTLHQADYLSQALDGFNEAFLMSLLSLCFPVMVPPAGSAELADDVANALTGYAVEQPRFDTFFSPLRGGFFKFDQLRLIDTFGQFQEIDCGECARAEDLRDSADVLGQYVMLPPRFIQPSRLAFDWIQARSAEICDFDLADSPVCGWLMPNHADQTLMIYDERGSMLGYLIATAFDGNGVQWRDAPGRPAAPAAAGLPGELPAAMNAEMQGFLGEMLRRSRELGEDVLTPFLRTVDSALWDVDRPSSAAPGGLSLFVGRPLVLARARIRLVQAGPPAAYKQLEPNNKPVPPIPDISIRAFEMPLWIGEQRHTEDGTIGFFVQSGDSAQHGYRQFNSAYAPENVQEHTPENEASGYFRRNRRIDIPADERAEGTTVSLILDPLSSIRLISGILPVSEQRIPQERIESALNRLYVMLYTGPLLLGEGRPLLPLTRLPDREWALITPGEAEDWIETQPLQPSNGNAFLAAPPIRAVEGWLQSKKGGDHESKPSS
ncbi:hypothetical protein [Saccharibacillus brassicae]|uniref:Uncharacterized protein n=1 Tax=Saccharibacillus brassicae TaxID=2583377 RepID=A0A4Y6UZT1_SACBS|nr:hypothetical protein [Saccharibacillus brassicae]QDH23259.1 hypothetical protein FFV09_21775 [Saccharibacillus brassicae]